MESLSLPGCNPGAILVTTDSLDSCNEQNQNKICEKKRNIANPGEADNDLEDIKMALENAWGYVASTKENLDNVGRRIAKAKSFLPEEANDRKRSNDYDNRMHRKYSSRSHGNRKSNKVQLNLNPEIRYKHSDDERIFPKEDLRLKRQPLYGEESSQAHKRDYNLDFQYEREGDSLTDRPRSPLVPRLNSSALGRSLGESIRESGAITRLRDKIQRQKDNLASPEQRAPFADKINHGVEDPVIPKDDFAREPMKRKVASVSSAPAYKGFNIPETKENIAQTSRLAGLQTQKLLAHQERKEKVSLRQQQTQSRPKPAASGPKKMPKKNTKKSPGKMQRIVAKSKPIPSITTTSWRAGQEAVKKALGAMKPAKEQTPHVEVVESEDEVSTSKTSDRDVISHSQTDTARSPIAHGHSETSETHTITSNADTERRVSIQDNDKSEVMDKDDIEEDLYDINKDLSMHEDLPEEAKSMLAELKIGPSGMDEDDSECEGNDVKETKPEPDRPRKPTGMKKSVKRKAPSSIKSKSEDDRSRRPKVRHYDQQAIQEYMAKQLAERNKKKQEEKRRQQKLKLEHEKQLMELYKKQKTSLKSSLTSKRKALLNSTFTNQDQDGADNLKQAKLQADTAMKKVVLEHITGSRLSTAASLDNSSNAVDSRASTYDVSSPMKPRIEDNLNDTSEVEAEFKDSLDLDQSGNHLLGIRSVTVTKGSKDSNEGPVTKMPPVRSAEEEVKELLEKYKMKSSFKPESTEEVAVSDIDAIKRSKAERIAAISATANSLRERLAAEANRLANLRMMANQEKPLPAQPDNYSEFRGALPGTGNIDEQVGLNKELEEKDEAATRIQAIFRGHSVRQGLNWKLPSGKSFGSSLQQARMKSKPSALQASLESSSRASSQSSYTSAFEAGSDVSSFSEDTGSTASLIVASKKVENKARMSRKRDYTRPQFKSLQGDGQVKRSKARETDTDRLSDVLKQGGGDRYSVINILARRMKEANRTGVAPKENRSDMSTGLSGVKSSVHDNSSKIGDSLYEQDFEEAGYDTSSSTIKTDALGDDHDSVPSQKENGESISRITEQAHSALRLRISDDNDSEDADKTLTLLPEDLHGDDTSVFVNTYISGQEGSTGLSPSNSRFTEGSELEKHPVMTSTMRLSSDRPDVAAHDVDDSFAISMHEASEKFSPGTLERKLRAEVNQLETMDDALRQVTDIERVRAVGLAQQETVSLAQLLKARQFGHQQELEKMSHVARDEALSKARELEKIQEAAAKSAESASRTIAEVRKEATDAITQSKQRCQEVEDEAKERAERAVMEVEKAQKLAADVILESTNRYSTNIENLATSTASAAASSAVQTALQIHKEQLEKLRNEAMNKVSKSYSQSTQSSGSASYSGNGDSTLTRSVSADESSTHVRSYADEEFEDVSDEKSSIAEKLDSFSRRSHSSLRETPSFTQKGKRESKSYSRISSSIRESKDGISEVAESISEELQQVQSSTQSSKTIDDDTPLTRKKSPHDRLKDSIRPSSDMEEESFKMEDHLASSLTEDEIDDGFRNLLPVVSHRRKSLERDRRPRHNKKLPYSPVSPYGSHSPFVGEDTFSEFTSGMVKQYLQEEAIRRQHQTALLKLREKALIDKTKAEMAWLDLQKSKLKNKGADDLMPPINKKQRGLIMKLQSEQSEIRRLKQAYKAASYERRFMLYQQSEISRLKKNTQKIWDKLGHEKASSNGSQGQDIIENQSISEASSIVSFDHSSVISEDLQNTGSHPSNVASSRESRAASATPTHTSKATPRTAVTQSKDTSVESAGEIEEDIESDGKSLSNDQSSFPSYTKSISFAKEPHKSGVASNASESVTGMRDSPSEDFSISERTEASLLNDLKRLKKKASEKYLMKREKNLKQHQSQFQSVLQKQNEMSDWQKRIEREEMRLKSEIKRALDKTRTRTTTPSLSPSKISTQESSESSRSEKPASYQVSSSSKEKSSGSDTSIPEDLKTAAVETDSELQSESIASKSASTLKGSDSSIVEDYGEDTFESPTATKSQTKKTSPGSGGKTTSSVRSLLSRGHGKESDESRSEEDISVADATSDASDIEKRIRQLEDELIRKRKDLDRVRRKKEKDQLRKKEQRLRQELQAVESLISIEDKENLSDRSVGDANAFIKGLVSPRILSPKILQQSNHLDQNAPRERKEENRAKSQTDHRKSDGTSGAAKYQENDAQRQKFEGPVVDRLVEESNEKVEKESDVFRHSEIRSISEELEAFKKFQGISEEEKPSFTSYADEDFESDKSLGTHRSSREVSEQHDPKTNSSVSESIVPDEKADNSESIVSDIHSRENSVAPDSERSSISSSKVDSQRSASSEATSKPSRTTSAQSHKSFKHSESIKENLEISQGSESIRSVLEATESEHIASDRSLQSKKDNSDASYHNDDIYEDDFFESSSVLSEKSQRSSRVSQRHEKQSSLSEVADEKSPVSESSRSASIHTEPLSASRSASASKSASKSASTSRSASKLGTTILGDSEPALSKYDAFHINDKVIVDGCLGGTVRFIGKTSFSPVVVAGVELHEKLGNTDGSFRGKRYFTCQPDHGLFSPLRNITLCKTGDLQAPHSNKLHDSSLGEVDDIISEHLDYSEKSNVNDSRSSLRLSLKKDSQLDSHKSDRQVSQKKTESPRQEQKSDCDSDGHDTLTNEDVSYFDDFEADLESGHKSSTHKESAASITENIISEHITAGLDTSKGTAKLNSHESNSTGSVTKKSASKYNNELLRPEVSDFGHLSSSPESFASSESEFAPQPPRVDLNQLADSLTESLLRKLLVESLKTAAPSFDQEEQSERVGNEEENCAQSLASDSKEASFSKSTLKESKDVNETEDSDAEVSEEIVESLSEKTDDTIKRMIIKNNEVGKERYETSEVYITPPFSDDILPSDGQKEQIAAVVSEEGDDVQSLLKEQGNQGMDIDRSEGIHTDKGMQPSKVEIAEKDIDAVTNDLLSSAISHMTTVMREKQAALSTEPVEEEAISSPAKQDSPHHHSPLQVNVIIKNKNGLMLSPPDLDTLPAPILGENEMDFDTDLLAAKLSELKKMDQEMDDLLGEDSDEDEPFALSGDRDILQLPDDEADLIPPVRDFEFNEPVLYVPHTVPEINKLVSESAEIIISKLDHRKDYDSITPSDSYLNSVVDAANNDFENSSSVLYKKMIFDITKDLIREANEFKSVQNVAKQPWTKPNRRVFAKFIRQIHHLRGQDLVAALQNHVSVCLGLEQGRPSLDVLKRRLPLNTAKKDYIDAILVEELREEEPQWVNYDEDELRVKDQLTQGILEGLIDETTNLLRDIYNKKFPQEDLV